MTRNPDPVRDRVHAISPSQCFCSAGGVTVGIDRSTDGDWYCEARREADGTITILDSYQVRALATKEPTNARD